ncbi:hypothetical protein [Actinoplanes sp. NPDC026619]|uniref:hypothetical protein n=1 Tax=Actinoplanes sp. NPDC026619 TaxID=3155798 RepID=UPI0033C321D5
MRTSGLRFRDPSAGLARFADDILVGCPACAGPASVRADPDADRPDATWLRRRLICAGCGHTAEWDAPRHGAGRLLPHLTGPDDPYFGLPLWLRTDVRRHVLWAYNARHLTLLEQYVTAELRERGPAVSCCSMTMIEQLPAWMKAAKHRPDLLRAIHRLQDRLL